METAQHPWLSGLFGDPEIEAILSPEAELSRMLQIEAAWTRTIAPKADAERIAAAILAAPIQPQDLKDGTKRDGLPVPDLIRLLKAQLHKEDQPWLHQGLTSQDVMDTALMISLQDIMPILIARLGTLIDALDALTKRDGERRLMAVTRMQHALPIAVQDKIEACRRPLITLAKQMPVNEGSPA
ncbi:MAG: lyase family protein [Ahrensia sp.]|nr:lyase family protein [Ahrensia sp.]